MVLSCATTSTFDGTFRAQQRPGQGVTAALLSQAGIHVFNEDQLEDAATHLRDLERETHD